jgi:hypothetical protein
VRPSRDDIYAKPARQSSTSNKQHKEVDTTQGARMCHRSAGGMLVSSWHVPGSLVQQGHVNIGVCTYSSYLEGCGGSVSSTISFRITIALSPPTAPVLYTATVQT